MKISIKLILWVMMTMVLVGTFLSSAYADWDIYDTVLVEDTTIVMDGNVAVHPGGSLTLDSVTLKMNVIDDGQYHIEVDSGGAMYILNGSIITDGDADNDSLHPDSLANARFFFWVRKGAKFEMRDTELHECGYEFNYPTFDHEGLWVGSDSSVIVNNTFSNNLAGIILFSSDHDSIINNIFANNSYGFCGDYSKHNTIEGNIYHSNDEVALLLWDCDSNTLRNNTTYGTELLHGICLRYSDYNTVVNCTTFENTEGGIDLRFSHNNVITQNLVRDNVGTGIGIGRESHSNIVSYNMIMDCDARKSYGSKVGSSLALHDKIGVYFWAHEGFGGCRDNIVKENQIIGFPRGIVIQQGNDNNSIVGNTIIADSIGVSIDSAQNITLNENQITGSLIYGVYLSNYAAARIEYCSISNNDGDGIFSQKSSSPIVNYNNIVSNTGYGLRNTDPTVTINAEHNWWGDPSGPGGVAPGTGDEVSEYVDYEPWLDRSVLAEFAVVSNPTFYLSESNVGNLGHQNDTAGMSLYRDPSEPYANFIFDGSPAIGYIVPGDAVPPSAQYDTLVGRYMCNDYCLLPATDLSVDTLPGLETIIAKAEFWPVRIQVPPEDQYWPWWKGELQEHVMFSGDSTRKYNWNERYMCLLVLKLFHDTPPCWWASIIPPPTYPTTLLGMLLDINAPSDSGAWNYPAYNETNRMISLQGYGAGVKENYRFALAQKDTCYEFEPGKLKCWPNPSTLSQPDQPYAMHLLRNDAFVYPQSGFRDDSLYKYMNTAGYSIYGDGIEEDYTIVNTGAVITAHSLTDTFEVRYAMLVADKYGTEQLDTLVNSVQCGNCDRDKVVGLADVVYYISYLFKVGGEPWLYMSDVDGNCWVGLADVVYMIAYLLKGGPPPRCSCADLR